MAKAPKPEAVAVRLTSTYSGHPGNPGPGQIVHLPAPEAERIIAIGGGVAV